MGVAGGADRALRSRHPGADSRSGREPESGYRGRGLPVRLGPGAARHRTRGRGFVPRGSGQVRRQLTEEESRMPAGLPLELDEVPAGVVVADETGQVVAVNAAAARRTGPRPDGAIGERIETRVR